MMPDLHQKPCDQCGHTNPPDAHFCVACGASMGLVCENCRTPLPPDANFCAACGTMATGREFSVNRQPAAVLAVQVTDLSEAETVSTATWRQMNNLFAALSQLCRAAGAWSMGTGDWRYFCFPQAAAAAPVAATALGVTLQLEARTATFNQTHNTNFRLRRGLHLDTVLSLAPSPQDPPLLMLGVAVQTAARLMHLADLDNTVVSEAVYQQTALDFVFAPVVGDSACYRLVETRANPAPQNGHRFYSPLVGRRELLAHLLALTSGTPTALRTLLIDGPAGSGKTRLLQAWRTASAPPANQPASVHWIATSAAPQRYYQPYALWRSLASVLLNLPDPIDAAALETALDSFGLPANGIDSAALADLLHIERSPDSQDEPPPVRDPQSVQAGYLWAVVHLLQAQTTTRPVILLIDDVHLADETSRQLLAELRRLLRNEPLLLVLTAPPQFNATWLDDEFEHLTLPPLSSPQQQTLLANFLNQDTPPPHLVNAILAPGDGRPLFILTALNYLRDLDLLVWTNGAWHAKAGISQVKIPADLAQLVNIRLEHLSPEAKRVLQIAAVAGNPVQGHWLSGVLLGN